ncbi:hypothetical protein HO173_002308 [Letharia columbiana]|uniref:RRM domain-containing protein n=1 Tax=Letharia columbiana TaxID=112416 RepID=A0A8H6G3A9_9LECA|nr:uncharacterized protein HO173_002308 [Letharia columbiana]KAF6239762.1 hypothetical protein HO173_002308 [Letharia columbiana]
MNTIREIQNLNKRELENGVSTEASWHADYRDTAYVYIGGLPFDLSEGDILTIFSQFGEPTYINLIRDKESGKSKGFAFLKYEDQRSTDLAVDNLGGASVMGRVLKVDHTRYKRKDGEEEEERERGLQGGPAGQESEEESEQETRPMVKEELELQKLLRDHDDDDPMKEYLVQEKREEVARAVGRIKDGGKEGKRKKEHEHRHHHRSDRHGHRERRRSDADGEKEDRRRPGYGDGHRHGHRRRSRSP